MDPTGWPGGHEIQAVRAEVGNCIPKETTLPPGVFAAPAALQPTRLSWYWALGVIASDMAWGTETADVWYLGCYSSVFSTRAGTQLLANDSHGDSAAHVSNRAPGKIHWKEKFIEKRRAALSHSKGETVCGKAAEAWITVERSIIKCQAHSFLISHKEKTTWQIQPSPEPGWQNGPLQFDLS